jgi:glycosyltransferase involved in cell wall biosynthesis
MSEADYMVVLDTGSTDNTLKLLADNKKKYPNLIYAQKIIDPWRFDVARNENIKLIPEDANILFENDLDE